MDLDEARWWCDRREACAGFSLSVAVPPSVIAGRTEEENGRAWVRFSTCRSMWYSAVGGAGSLAGWLSYAKVDTPISGAAANLGATRGAPLTWLQQPGFIVAPKATAEEMMAGTAHLLRIDEQAALLDVVDWCASSDTCEGFTASQPPAGSVPVDRLQTACYCCRVDVRTSRAQQSWTKWAMPSRRSYAQLEDSIRVYEEEKTREQQPRQGPPPSASPPLRIRSSRESDEVPAALQLALRRLASSGQLSQQPRTGRAGEKEAGLQGAELMDDADTKERPEAAAESAEYIISMGYFIGGTELHSAFLNVEDASAWCARHVKCRGFAARSPQESDGAAAVLYISFSAGSNEVLQHPKWIAWSKVGVEPADGEAVVEAKEEL